MEAVTHNKGVPQITEISNMSHRDFTDTPSSDKAAFLNMPASNRIALTCLSTKSKILLYRDQKIHWTNSNLTEFERQRTVRHGNRRAASAL